MSSFYFAPMMGVANHIYRNTHYAMFGEGIDKYFTPFFAPHAGIALDTKDTRILTESKKITEGALEGTAKPPLLVPQILTNCAEDYLRMEEGMVEMGFHEVNINLGCPSQTVIGKKRGSGFLRDPREVDRFLEEIFAHCKAEVSVKTRIGFERKEEFGALLEVYNKYPMKELIVHPRTGRQEYRGTADKEMFGFAVRYSVNPVCYNGDIRCREDLEDLRGCVERAVGSGDFCGGSLYAEMGNSGSGDIMDRIPVMIGRGLLANPALVREFSGGKRISIGEIGVFLETLRRNFRADSVKFDDHLVLCKMKECWKFLKALFPERMEFVQRVFFLDGLEEYLEWEMEALDILD